MAYTPFTKDDQPTMQAFNEKFEQAIAQAIDSGLKAEIGSYVGTGEDGAENPNKLTFSFIPSMVIVVKQGSYGFALDGTFGSYSLFWIPGITYFNPGGSGSASYADAQKNKITLSGKTLIWYRDSGSENGNPSHQLNELGTTYFYAAIGRAEVT